MSYTASPPLHQQVFSLDHAAWVDRLATTDNLLIIQDLDGVCMGLVKDPLHRVVDLDYLEATQCFDGHFYVLTNGEHTGQRGMNGIVGDRWGKQSRPGPDATIYRAWRRVGCSGKLGPAKFPTLG